MRKLIYALIAYATILVGCSEKEQDNPFKFEGSQWIAEEIPSELGLDLKGELLIDANVNEQGKISFAIIAQKNDKMGVEEGDIIILQSDGYNISEKDDSGKKYSLLVKEQFYSIEFINENTLKLFITEDSYYIFTRVSNNYSLSNAKYFDDLIVSLIPSKESDWAGGEIEFSLSNGAPIKSIKFDVVSQNVTVYNDMNSILEDNVITLGFYEANGKIANASMVITATDYNGKEYWCTIMSKGWRPAFYKEVGEEFKEVDPSQTWERGENCWIGVESYEGEVEYTGNTDSFEGIRYSNTLFDAAGSSNNKICFDIPHTNGYDTFYFWYGEQYSFATKIEITD